MTGEVQTAESGTEATESITTLGDVFDDSTETEAKPKVEAAVTETTEEKGETVEAKPQGEAETTEEPPSSDTTSLEEAQKRIAELEGQVNGFKATAIAERKKRQEAEKSAPDPVEDPQGYADHVKDQSAANELNTRITLSRDVMMELKDDFAEKEAVFLDMVGIEVTDGQVTGIKNQHLYQQFQEAQNPAKFAYDTAKDKLELEELRSPNYRDKLKAELLAEIKAEQDKSKPTSEVPDLVTATADGANSEKQEEPLTLSTVFN